MLKLAVYILSSIIVIYAADSVNLNGIFKKNKVVQARIFYVVTVLSLIYLLTHCLFDLVTLKLF